MSDLAYLARRSADAVSADLSGRTAGIARRVAAVVHEHCTPESGALDTVAFLQGWSESVESAASDPAPLTSPLLRIERVFDLTEDEVDLVLLAGMTEEHEGLAATFRSLHPTGEPRPTAGLGALLLGGGPRDRARVRAVLSSGRAVEHELLRLEGTVPFFERSLVLADELWSVLHGCDAWPAGLPRAATVGAPAGMDVLARPAGCARQRRRDPQGRVLHDRRAARRRVRRRRALRSDRRGGRTRRRRSEARTGRRPGHPAAGRTRSRARRGADDRRPRHGRAGGIPRHRRLPGSRPRHRTAWIAARAPRQSPAPCGCRAGAGRSRP